MNKKMSKRQRDIKTKLMAAICMLLVSSIMMVSTTYAWFTLSTAPEVTGINTAVGANGNLEMALMPTDAITKGVANDYGITSSAGDSGKDATIKNLTWGNLVDLGSTDATKAFYGLDKITLYPSALNVAVKDAQDNPTTLALAMLQTPTYGADGRVSGLVGNTVTSTYVAADKNFPQNSYLGVRAVGNASGMTDRQHAYRNALSAASTAMTMAKTTAAQSLNTNGASLADIALAHGVNANATHTLQEVGYLKAIVSDLVGTTGTDAKTGVLQYIESAYLNYIIAYGASAESGMTDDQFKVFQSVVDSADDVYDAIVDIAAKATEIGATVTLPSDLTTPLGLLEDTREAVETAQRELNAITTEPVAWGTLSTPLNRLAKTDKIKINGYEASTVKTNMSAIVNSVASQGLNVVMATGGGVYADVADHCGDYDASIVIKKVEYNGLVLENMNARMKTESTLNPSYYLVVLDTAVQEAGSPASAGGQVMPITDMYGYIIDLAFRTNAADSNLLLQTLAIDRIYGSDGSADTMGHGSTMTFKSTTPGFSDDQVKELMKAIRVVFFNPTNRAVLGTAKLKMDTAKLTAEGITADLYLYKLTKAGEATYTAVNYNNENPLPEYYTRTEKYTAVSNDVASTTSDQLYLKAADSETYTEATYTAPGEGQDPATYYTKGYTYTPAATPATATEQLYAKNVSEGGETILNGTDAVITALTQNKAIPVSALVYLDGEKVGNDDVAATVATSMTGTMNLQFASSAKLMPMEYTPLMNQDKEEFTVTPPATIQGVTFTGETKATESTAYTFKLKNENATAYTVSYKVGDGTAVPMTELAALASGATAADVTYTIPASDVTGNITITVTAK